MSRFDAVNDITVPDQWEEIARRRAARVDDDPVHRPRGWRVPTALLVVVVAGIAAVVWRHEAPSSVETTEPSAVSPTSQVAGNEDSTTLLCPDGGIVASTIPADAEVGEGSVRRTWRTADGIDVQLLVPGLAYIDFVGERTEEVTDPRGMLLFRLEETRFVGGTGFVGPCSGYELAATGGTEESRRAVVLDTAKGFMFDPALGATDCGPISDAYLHAVSGDNAMAAVSTLEAADLFLSPQIYGGGATDLQARPDGRCDVVVSAQGGLRPIATLSGDQGTYALDAVRGYAPNGVDAPGSTIELNPSGSVQVIGRDYTIAVDYWCDDCASAVLTIHYPDDDITATQEVNVPGPFAGTLPAASNPGSFGWITIEWTSTFGDGRGIWTGTISSGDFAAG